MHVSVSWSLVCKRFDQDEKYFKDFRHSACMCKLITDKSHCAENGLVGWRWAAGGKCLVWAAVMVVPLSLLLCSLLPSVPLSSTHLFLLGLPGFPSGRPQ